MPSNRTLSTRFYGCLLGGAVGDALGRPVEFMSWNEIRQVYGPSGIADLDQTDGAFTDDTQMSLFTAEGLLEAGKNWCGTDWESTVIHVYHAYLRWLVTQGITLPGKGFDGGHPGGLVTIPGLHARRAPGDTCLSALCSAAMGSIGQPINNSKGCGGVMRAAPAGLYAARMSALGHELGAQDAFELGCRIAAITHGHPDGYLPAGFLAALVFLLVQDIPVAEAIQRLLPLVAQQDNAAGFTAMLEKVLTRHRGGVLPTAESIAGIGGGWAGDEALAIALFCVLAAEGDLVRCIRSAVNHSGDSDSTGSIAGNIIGAELGHTAVPLAWKQRLVLGDTVQEMAIALAV